MRYSIYEVLLLFCFYSVIGWCTEVIYATVNSGKFVNRGFLNGPVCPIYGAGVVLVLFVLEPLKDNIFILFIGSVLLTSLIEFITGLILEKIFNDKWWDYSKDPFNIRGYICLKFSLLWGVACIVVVDVIEPLIYDLIKVTPKVFGYIILTISLIIFLIDFIVTVSAILKFKKRLYIMDELVSKLKDLSDEIGENLSDGVLVAMEKQEVVKENVEDVRDKFILTVDIEKRKKELEELKDKYRKYFENKEFGYERLFKAFPALQKGKYKERIEKIKNICNRK